MWTHPDSAVSLASFQLEWSRHLNGGNHWIVADSGVTYSGFPPTEARNWVLSPDNSYAVRFLPNVDEEGYPILEPDSGVFLSEFGRGRMRTILYCGTPCNFQIAEWIDAETVLIGGGNWDELAPMVYRVSVVSDSVEIFQGPQRPADQREELEARSRDLWNSQFPWIRYIE